MPIRTEPVMGTLVTIHVVGECESGALDRAFGWFHEIEKRCTRFDADSELMQLCSRTGEAVLVSPMLFEAIRFAKLVADESGGAFDPTVGHRMAARGFNREHRTNEVVGFPNAPQEPASFHDIQMDPEQRTITILRPLILDLGAVAKGLAIDMAARELQSFENFAIDAGGDLFFAGQNSRGEPWSAGIRHPRTDGLIATVRVSNLAVCTSGDYEKFGTNDAAHILDPRISRSAWGVASSTVIAPNAMLADALATAAFVLGPAEGIRFLTRLGVEGLIITPALEQHQTQDFRHAA
jgi:thiamine biosynthesis lipoprotein